MDRDGNRVFGEGELPDDTHEKAIGTYVHMDCANPHGTGQLFAHEIGHVLGLVHPQGDSPPRPGSPDDLMNGRQSFHADDETSRSVDAARCAPGLSEHDQELLDELMRKRVENGSEWVRRLRPTRFPPATENDERFARLCEILARCYECWPDWDDPDRPNPRGDRDLGLLRQKLEELLRGRGESTTLPDEFYDMVSERRAECRNLLAEARTIAGAIDE